MAPGLGQDVLMANERRKAQNRLAQRRRRQKQALQKQAPLEQNLVTQAGILQTGVQADIGFPPSDGSIGLNPAYSFPPFLGSDMTMLGFSPSWDNSVLPITGFYAPTISSANLLGSVHTDPMIPPSTGSLENPETVRLAALAFARGVVPRCDPTFSNNRNEPLIHTAARGNDVATLRLLMQAGLKVNERDHEGRTALHAAYEEHHMEAIVWLLEQGVDVNAVDKQGRTALSMAVNNKCPVGVKLMLSHGADIAPKSAEQVHALSTSD